MTVSIDYFVRDIFAEQNLRIIWLSEFSLKGKLTSDLLGNLWLKAVIIKNFLFQKTLRFILKTLQIFNAICNFQHLLYFKIRSILIVKLLAEILSVYLWFKKLMKRFPIRIHSRASLVLLLNLVTKRCF